MDKVIKACAAAAASMGAFAGTANAAPYNAPTVSATGRVIYLEPLSFIKIDDLDFGGFIIPSSGSGLVSIDPATGGFTADPALQQLSQFAPQRGRFEGAGSVGQGVDIVAVLPTKLYLNGDTTSTNTVDVALSLDVPADPLTGHFDYVIGSSSAFDVYVGGDVTVTSGLAPGSYSNVYMLSATYQ